MTALKQRHLPCTICDYIKSSQTVGPPPGALLAPRRVRFLCMRDIFILDEIWKQDKIYILVDIYHLLQVLAPSSKFCRWLKLACLLSRNTPTSNNEVTLLSQLILFLHYYADKRNYCTFGFIFIYRTNIPYHFPSCVTRNAKQSFKVDNNKRLIQV
jgi:hypothetical protein